MTETSRQTLVAAVGIVALGVLIGVANNLLAGDARKLDWVGAYPPKGEPGCKKYEAELAAKAAGATSPAPVETAASGTAASGTVPSATPLGETAPASGTVPETAPTGDTAPSPAPTATASVPPVPPDKSWLELAPAQVKTLFDQNALFIDARRTSQFEEGHVAGAMSIPIWESGVDEKVAQVIFQDRIQGNMSAPIVVYCNGGDCEDSHMVGDKLQQAGFTSVYVYKDGWPDWTKSGGPTAAGGQ